MAGAGAGGDAGEAEMDGRELVGGLVAGVGIDDLVLLVAGKLDLWPSPVVVAAVAEVPRPRLLRIPLRPGSQLRPLRRRRLLDWQPFEQRLRPQ